jgi:hypothetical protein
MEPNPFFARFFMKMFLAFGTVHRSGKWVYSVVMKIKNRYNMSVRIAERDIDRQYLRDKKFKFMTHVHVYTLRKYTRPCAHS